MHTPPYYASQEDNIVYAVSNPASGSPQAYNGGGTSPGGWPGSYVNGQYGNGQPYGYPDSPTHAHQLPGDGYVMGGWQAQSHWRPEGLVSVDSHGVGAWG